MASTLISCDPSCYYKGFHPVGETFTVADKSHAQTLKALGRAKDATPPSRYQRKDVVPADVEAPDDESINASEAVASTQRKRTYRRRDLTAEDPQA